MKLKRLALPLILFAVFIVYTIVVKFVDAAAIGPLDSTVGFATINGFIANRFPYNDLFYKLTKVIALGSFACIGAFAVTGLYQLIKTKSFKKVDLAIYAMAGAYVITMLFYILFEIVVINYRPILEDGELEASFPSSHTMLAVSVFGCAVIYLANRMKQSALSKVLQGICVLCAAAMPAFRMISGVHWFTDILGGVLLGCAIISLYLAFIQSLPEKKETK